MQAISDTKVFVTVVEEGSFTAAAEALGLSKGAVSKYVGRLERRLGARLLNRTTRRLTLTEIGERHYERTSRALAEIRAAEQDVAEQADRPRGHLRVTAPDFYGAEILARHLGEFRARYPDISVELALENRVVDLVRERFDAAIRMAAPKDSSLVMRKIADVPMVVCASPEYLERRGRPAAPQDLRDHDCLIYTQTTRMHEWIFHDADGRPVAVPVSGYFHSNDDHALLQAGLQGAGVLRMPKLFVAAAIDQGRLLQLWPDHACPSVPLAIVYPSRRDMPAKARVFIDFVAALGRHGSRSTVPPATGAPADVLREPWA